MFKRFKSRLIGDVSEPGHAGGALPVLHHQYLGGSSIW